MGVQVDDHFVQGECPDGNRCEKACGRATFTTKVPKLQITFLFY